MQKNESFKFNQKYSHFKINVKKFPPKNTTKRTAIKFTFLMKPTRIKFKTKLRILMQ